MCRRPFPLKTFHLSPPPPNNLLFCLLDAMLPASPLHSFLFSRPPFLSPHPSFSASDLPPSSLLLMPPPPPPAREEGTRGSTHRRDNYVAVPLPPSHPRPISLHLPSARRGGGGGGSTKIERRRRRRQGAKKLEEEGEEGDGDISGIGERKRGEQRGLCSTLIYFSPGKTSAVRFPPKVS